VKDIRVIIPRNAQSKPSADSRGAIKEKVFHSFLIARMTEGTNVSLITLSFFF
jgi:hypothetical protein